jgi:hypothetical protein
MRRAAAALLAALAACAGAPEARRPGAKHNYPWSKSGPEPPGFPFSGVEGLGRENDWGSLGIPESELARPPVFDGMAAAQGRIYLTTTDGTVRCLGNR